MSEADSNLNPGHLLANYLIENPTVIKENDQIVLVFQIISKTSAGHTALQKFVQSGGIQPFFELCS